MDGTPANAETGQDVTATPAKAVDQAGKRSKPSAKSAQGSKGKGRTPRSTEMQAPQYNIRATVVRRRITVGNQGLARVLENNWKQIHHSIYYIAVFAPTAIGGRIVNAADVGISEYINERVEAAERLLSEAQSQAQDSAIEMGEPGQTTDHLVEVSSQLESQVLKMLRAYDDYLVVMDSLWIAGEVLHDKRNAAHKMVKDDVAAMTKLLNKLRSRLINYRRDKGASKLTKNEQALVVEVEDIIIASLSEQAAQKRLQARERIEAKARLAEPATAPKVEATEGTRSDADNQSQPVATTA